MNNQIEVKQSTGFAVSPKDLTEAFRFAEMISKSQLCPKNYMNRPDDTLIAMMMGNELGLNPLQAIQNIAVINGRPSIYGDALMALVQNHSSFKSVEESFDEETFTAICTVQRKNGKPHTQRYSRQDAETAKLWGKAGPWSQYPKRMMAMRARGFALRNQFADALAGLITREEAEDMPLEREINPIQESASVEQIAVEPTPYTDEEFKGLLPKWGKAIELGKQSAKSIITSVKGKGRVLTETQEIQLGEFQKVEKAA